MNGMINDIGLNINITRNNCKTKLFNGSSKANKLSYKILVNNKIPIDINKDDVAFSEMLSKTESYLFSCNPIMKTMMSGFLTRVLQGNLEEGGQQHLKAWVVAVKQLIDGQENRGSASGLTTIKKSEGDTPPFFNESILEVNKWIKAVEKKIEGVRLNSNMQLKIEMSYLPSPTKLSDFLSGKSFTVLGSGAIQLSEDDFTKLSVFVFRKWVERYLYSTKDVRDNILSFCDSPNDLMEAILHGIYHKGSNPALMDCIDVTWL